MRLWDISWGGSSFSCWGAVLTRRSWGSVSTCLTRWLIMPVIAGTLSVKLLTWVYTVEIWYPDHRYLELHIQTLNSWTLVSSTSFSQLAWMCSSNLKISTIKFIWILSSLNLNPLKTWKYFFLVTASLRYQSLATVYLPYMYICIF